MFVSTTPAELILLTGEPSYVAGRRARRPALGQQHRERRVPDGQDRRRLLPRRRAAGSRRRTSRARGRSRRRRCRRTSRRSRSSTRARACSPSVPGTQQAAEAVLLAQVPQTARVNKKELKAPEVAYQGEPKFEPIEKTTRRARGEHRQGHLQGRRPLLHVLPGRVVHGEERRPARGRSPTSVPKEIYEIPVELAGRTTSPTSRCEDDDDDEWVTFAAVGGYTGMMVAWGCAVWGSGWYYPPYWGWGGFYPYYYPHYPTYGYGAWYNPWTGALRPQRGRVRPVRRRRRRRALQPAHRHLRARRGGVGPVRRARRTAQAYNPRTGTYAQTRQGSNVYGSWGSTVRAARRRLGADRARHEQPHRQHDARDAGQRRRRRRSRATRPGPGGGTVARTGSGDVYAGRDGNVYKKRATAGRSTTAAATGTT